MSWLSEMRAGGPEIVVPGYPASDCADLRIGPDSVMLSTASAIADLAWSDHGETDGWRITYLKQERPSPRGASVAVTGAYVERTEPIWRSTRSWRNRLKKATSPFDTSGSPRSIPLTNVGRVVAEVIAARDTLEALCCLLTARPPLRDRLSEANVTSRLVSMIMIGAVPQLVDTQLGVRRLTTETLVAMRSVGLRHALMGRPLPGNATVSAHEAADRVVGHLSRSPYAHEIEIDRAHVTDIIRRYYLDVEPWPFSPLTE